MFFRKYINKTVIVATKENRLGINNRKAYSTNPIPKKSAETMLTKLLTINGSEVVHAINQLAIIKIKNQITINIYKTHSTNPIPKKSHETKLTKLLTINGSEVVSAINPLAIIKGKIIFSLKFKCRTMASTIGVSINAAPSFAKKAATIAPKTLM